MVQGNNFGIGLEGTGTDDNVVAENTVFGTSNGLFMTVGIKGNIISGNLFVGNPSVQVSVDHSPDNGFDIKNLAADGDNTFRGNTCFTSTNAPCSPVGGRPKPRQ